MVGPSVGLVHGDPEAREEPGRPSIGWHRAERVSSGTMDGCESASQAFLGCRRAMTFVHPGEHQHPIVGRTYLGNFEASGSAQPVEPGGLDGERARRCIIHRLRKNRPRGKVDPPGVTQVTSRHRCGRAGFLAE